MNSATTEHAVAEIRAEIERVVSTPFPDYAWPLEIARSWIRAKNEQFRLHAPELLSRLRERYPYAIQFAQEQTLALIQCGRVSEARKLLEESDQTFGSPDEELLCRWGRIYKDESDKYLDQAVTGAQTGAANSQVQSFRERARECYLLALDKYDAAYRIRQGHYPGINKATLLLILAGLPGEDREQRLRDCQDLAQELLARQSSWPKALPDDNIWHLATEGEAHFLLRHWDEAADRYRRAADDSKCEQFHIDCMKKQVLRICEAFRRIGVDSFGPLSVPSEIFPEPNVAHSGD